MGMSPEQQAQLKAQMAAQLEALIGEHVEAFGFFGHPGFLENQPDRVLARLEGGSGGFNIFSWFRGRRAAGGMPTQVYLVVTPTRVLAVKYRVRFGGVVEPDQVLQSWDRGGVVIEVGDPPADADPAWTGATVRITEVGADRPVELESFDRGTGVNDEVLTLLRG